MPVWVRRSKLLPMKFLMQMPKAWEDLDEPYEALQGFLLFEEAPSLVPSE